MQSGGNLAADSSVSYWRLFQKTGGKALLLVITGVLTRLHLWKKKTFLSMAQIFFFSSSITPPLFHKNNTWGLFKHQWNALSRNTISDAFLGEKSYRAGYRDWLLRGQGQCGSAGCRCSWSNERKRALFPLWFLTQLHWLLLSTCKALVVHTNRIWAIYIDSR